jgi:hypothetical protein
MFQVVEWHWELIIYFLPLPKYDLREVEKAMFLGVESQCEIIFCLLGIQKCDLDEVEEAMLKWSNGPEKSFPAFWPP